MVKDLASMFSLHFCCMVNFKKIMVVIIECKIIEYDEEKKNESTKTYSANQVHPFFGIFSIILLMPKFSFHSKHI
jgi:hypothetical protein